MAEAIEGGASEVAERYAQAAFDLAKEANALDTLDKDLATFRAAVVESADLRTALRSPLIDSDEKSRALAAVADKLGLSILARNFIGVLAKNGRAGDFAAVASAYKRLLAKHRGASQVEIVSARPLDQGQIDRIAQALSGSLGKIEPTVKVDESLIGGFIVRAGSRQFDSSIKSKLDSLKIALKGA